MSNVARLKELKRVNAMRLWRAQFPWTNEEFIAAIQQDTAAQSRPTAYHVARRDNLIAWIRSSGHISKAVVSIAMSWLVKTCAVCGEPALYRIGVEGRCKAHMQTMSGIRPKALALQRLKGIRSERVANAKDAYLRRRDSAIRRDVAARHRARK